MAAKACIICGKEVGKLMGNVTADKSMICNECAIEITGVSAFKIVKTIKKLTDAELINMSEQSKSESAEKHGNFEDFKNGSIKEVTFEFKGAEKAIVTLDQTGITIDKKGVLNALTVGITGAKKIPYSSITAVHFKEPGKITSGILQFAVLGAHAANSGMTEAAQDKNAVMFLNNELEKATNIRDFVDEKISGGGVLGGTTVINEKSPAEEVKALKELLDMGVLTQEEFDIKKKELLGL